MAERSLPAPEAAAAPRRLRYWTPGLGLFALGWLAVFAAAFPDAGELAERHWPLILVGFAGAVAGNITAVGGGLVFVPVAILVYQLPAVAALQLALVSQAFGMSSGAIGWLGRRVVPLAALRWTVPPLLAGSLVSTFVVSPSPLLVKGIFGPASIAIGVVMLLLLGRRGELVEIPPRDRWLLVACAFAGGLLTGWIAIGIGELVAAYLMLRHGIRAEVAIGLGVVLLAINSVALALVHGLVVGGVPWELAAFTILGCVFGARLGPFLSQWVPGPWLKITFAAIAIADGAVFLLQFLRTGG